MAKSLLMFGLISWMFLSLMAHKILFFCNQNRSVAPFCRLHRRRHYTALFTEKISAELSSLFMSRQKPPAGSIKCIYNDASHAYFSQQWPVTQCKGKVDSYRNDSSGSTCCTRVDLTWSVRQGGFGLKGLVHLKRKEIDARLRYWKASAGAAFAAVVTMPTLQFYMDEKNKVVKVQLDMD